MAIYGATGLRGVAWIVTNRSRRHLNGRRQRVVKDETTKPPLRDMTEVLGAQRGEQVHTELTMEMESEIDSKVS